MASPLMHPMQLVIIKCRLLITLTHELMIALTFEDLAGRISLDDAYGRRRHSWYIHALCVCVYIHMCMYIMVYKCLHVSLSIEVITHTHTHTYTHTHIHTYTHRNASDGARVPNAGM
jgi:hypothetical protein